MTRLQAAGWAVGVMVRGRPVSRKTTMRKTGIDTNYVSPVCDESPGRCICGELIIGLLLDGYPARAARLPKRKP